MASKDSGGKTNMGRDVQLPSKPIKNVQPDQGYPKQVGPGSGKKK